MSSELPEHPKGALRSGNIADELARGPRHLHVVVVSPAQPIFEGDVPWVTVPAWDGQLGIWPGHAAIVGCHCQIAAGDQDAGASTKARNAA